VRIGIISDIHGNLEALESVSNELKDVDKIICLGDIVGYGPDPETCIEIVKEISSVIIAGNHDWGVCEKTDIKNFNRVAKEAILWTKDNLKETSKNFLSSLPLIHKEGDYIFSHSTFNNPSEWDYILYEEDASIEFRHFEEIAGFVGHSHIPVVFVKLNNDVYAESVKEIILNKNARFIINPGSVGQPRDGISDASFLILDTEKSSIIIKRKMYDIKKTYEKILKNGLPKILGERLFYGK